MLSKCDFIMTSEQIYTLFTLMVGYFPPTLKLFFFTLLYAIPFGMIVALLKMYRIKLNHILVSFLAVSSSVYR